MAMINVNSYDHSNDNALVLTITKKKRKKNLMKDSDCVLLKMIINKTTMVRIVMTLNNSNDSFDDYGNNVKGQPYCFYCFT